MSPLILLIALLVMLGACGSDATVASKSGSTKTTSTTVATSDANSSATTATTAAGATGTVVGIATSSLGKIVTNGSGQTLYMFTPDSATSSTCTGGCASAWPPVPGPATSGVGVDAGQLGVVSRADGSQQATFAGHPLYTFSGDISAGDVKGQGTGGKWYVLDSAGAAVTGAAASTPTTAAPTTADDSGY